MMIIIIIFFQITILQTSTDPVRLPLPWKAPITTRSSESAGPWPSSPQM
jgi:hypothetical protein